MTDVADILAISSLKLNLLIQKPFLSYEQLEVGVGWNTYMYLEIVYMIQYI